jgi:hypothetical protein
MKKGLFILYEGLPANVIDSQVLVHCRDMRRYGIDMEVWSFAWGSLYESSQKRLEYAKNLAQGEVKLFRGIRPIIPGSEQINATRLRRQLNKLKRIPQFIHARTDYTAHICARALGGADGTPPLIWDCRGHGRAEFRARHQGKLPALLIRLLEKRIAYSSAMARAYSAHAVFVSSYLQKTMEFTGPSWVIGCMADNAKFHYDSGLRFQIRQELGLTGDARLLIYSGGMAEYQCFPQCVEFFRIIKRLNQRWRFLVLTTDPKTAEPFLKGCPDVISLSVPFDQVNGYLNAADIGVLLRAPHELNRAASPTKFAEYSLAGLSVAASPGIGDLDSLGAEMGCLIPAPLDELSSSARRVVEAFAEIERLDDSAYHNARFEMARRATQLVSRSNGYESYLAVYDIGR